MYAVFSTGGKQYRATTGDVIKVEKLEAEKGATIELDQVLMVGEGEDVKVGSPLVAGGKVICRVVDHGRGDKVKIIKFKRRKHHMKTMGHRQYFTMLEVTGIEGAEQKKAAKKAAEPKAEKPTKAAKPKKEAKPEVADAPAVEEAVIEETAVEETPVEAVEEVAEEAAPEAASEETTEDIEAKAEDVSEEEKKED